MSTHGSLHDFSELGKFQTDMQLTRYQSSQQGHVEDTTQHV